MAPASKKSSKRSSTLKNTPAKASARRSAAAIASRSTVSRSSSRSPSDRPGNPHARRTVAGRKLHAARQALWREAAQGRARRTGGSPPSRRREIQGPAPRPDGGCVSLRRQFELLRRTRVPQGVRPAMGNDHGWLPLGAHPRFSHTRRLQPSARHRRDPNRDRLSEQPRWTWSISFRRSRASMESRSARRSLCSSSTARASSDGRGTGRRRTHGRPARTVSAPTSY